MQVFFARVALVQRQPVTILNLEYLKTELLNQVLLA
jgi:hypothetical protein